MKFLKRSLGWLALFLSGSVLAQPDAVDADGYNRYTIRLSDIPVDAPRFEDYLVRGVFKGKIATPDVHTHPTARLYRTLIRDRAKVGVNFAGHYILLGWGSLVTSWAILDAKTGHLFFPVNLSSTDEVNVADEVLIQLGSTVGYRADSRLLRVVGGVNEESGLRGTSYFVWENNQLRRIRFIPKPYPPENK